MTHIRRWFRRWRYRQLETELVELKSIQLEINMMLENAKYVPQFVHNFRVETEHNLARLESKLAVLRKEGI